MNEVTSTLSAIEAGDPHAAAGLLPLVYDELRKLAAAQGGGEIAQGDAAGRGREVHEVRNVRNHVRGQGGQELTADHGHEAQREETMRCGAVSAGILCPFALLLLALPPGRAAAAPPDRGLTDTSASPHVVLRSVGLADVKWTR